jgi:hypothetical protein
MSQEFNFGKNSGSPPKRTERAGIFQIMKNLSAEAGWFFHFTEIFNVV